MTNKEYRYNLSIGDKGTAARTLRLVGAGKQVLELGCSVGTQSRVLAQELGCKVTGVELNPIAADQARSYCERVIVCDINHTDLSIAVGKQLFDVILCADVLEHLYDPAQVLKKITDLLRPDGFVVASIPHIAHAAIAYELAHGRFSYRKTGLLDDTHIRFFSIDGLIATFTIAGFEIVEFDRGLLAPQETEFSVKPQVNTDQVFLDYIYTNNPEALTYHFIIKARPSTLTREKLHDINSEISKYSSTATDATRDSVRQEARARLERLSSIKTEYEWLSRKKSYRALMKLASIFSRIIRRQEK